ncbi:hypothetical protein H632_c82p0 [Helicosporidium sp. ATCC 50920]|nr:hypothetical protein H632_c82p0 [Helicosporidium sp. ATCC 50920]|eukprot:KDD76868.1 hypothetical protein H632_c82p0 [Helicosporidium sp. ATCC 50920]
MRNAAVSSFLSSLPNRGIFSNVQPGAVFRSPSRPSLADQFADPPPGQRLSKLITLDTLTELFMSQRSSSQYAAESTKKSVPFDGSAPAASGRKRALKQPVSEGRTGKKAASSASTSQAPGTSATAPHEPKPSGSGDGDEANAPAPAPPAPQRGQQQASASAGKSSPRTTKADAPGTGRGSAASHAAGVPEPSKARFNRLELQAKTLRELQGVARAWKLTSGGKKEDLITRLLEHQRQRKA